MDLISVIKEVLPGAISGISVSWIFRNWIAERLKQSISHEYSSRLENLKNELNGKLEIIKHQNEVQQLRTSLFFEHQRTAFAEILAKVAKTNEEWWRIGYEPEVGLTMPVSGEHLRELREIYFKHQLFLDAEALMALDLLLDVYTESMPFDDPDYDPNMQRDAREPYDNAEYIRPRLAALFQRKIGVATDARAVKQIALFGAIRILNKYHFPQIALPVRGELSLEPFDNAAEAVMKAEQHCHELIAKAREFRAFLRTETSFFHEAETSLNRYLMVLDGERETLDLGK
jgi:hypothetical protein